MTTQVRIGALSVVLLGVVGVVLCLRLELFKPTAPRHDAGYVVAKDEVVTQTVLAADIASRTRSARQSETPEASVIVEGYVRDKAGKPVRGALVCGAVAEGVRPFLKTEAKKPDDRLEQSSASDAQGHYVLAVFFPDLEYTFSASAEGYIPVLQGIRIPKEGTEHLDFVLEQSARISGWVLDTERNTVAYAIVVAVPEEGQRRESQLTDVTGTFDITDLISGKDYALTIRYLPPGAVKTYPFGLEMRPEGNPVVNVPAGHTLDRIELIVPWARDRSVSGCIRDERGQPLAGVAVVANAVIPAAAPVGVALSLSDDQGRYRIEHIADTALETFQVDTVNLRFTCTEYEPVTIQNVAVGSESVDVVLARVCRGTISGVVLDQITGKPVTKARVYLQRVACLWGEGWERGLNDVTEALRSEHGQVNDRGEFTISDVRAGIASLLVCASGYGMSTKDDIVVEPQRETTMKVFLTPSGRLRVRTQLAGRLAEYAVANYFVWCRPLGEEGDGFSLCDYVDAVARGTESAYGQPPFSELPAREMDLAPGSYDVIICIYPQMNDGNCRIFHRTETEVVSGNTTELRVEVGRESSAITGIIAITDSNTIVRIAAAPGAGVEGLESTKRYGDSSWVQEALSRAAAYGDYFWASPGPGGNYTLEGVPSGAYTVTGFIQRSNGTVSIVGSQNILVGPGEEATANLDE